MCACVLAFKCSLGDKGQKESLVIVTDNMETENSPGVMAQRGKGAAKACSCIFSHPCQDTGISVNVLEYSRPPSDR